MGRLMVRADVQGGKDLRKDIITAGLESGISAFVIRDCDRDFLSLGRFDSIITSDSKFDGSYECIDIDGKDGQKRAMSLAGKKNIIISANDWKVIPVENVIGAFDGKGTKVIAVTDNAADAKLLLTVMEKGADYVMMTPEKPSDLTRYADITQTDGAEKLSEIEIESVRPVEMGDRVCIDTCVSMSPGEGMLIGSYSDCLFLVESESEENGYVATRPFRVNAGAVHSYIQVPGGKTRYLSELSSGDSVLICDPKGNTRVATIGRCKIERRPLLMVKGTCGKRECSVVLQNAETIRLVSENGTISVTELKKGDRVLGMTSEGGRHFGMKVNETVSEK